MMPDVKKEILEYRDPSAIPYNGTLTIKYDSTFRGDRELMPSNATVYEPTSKIERHEPK